ncbi:MAG: GGDEF domain-containing protein [Lachnospiraceae bacterium]|nr:GGDEF domain-containing protein [Lachnospiraceae bacterium]
MDISQIKELNAGENRSITRTQIEDATEFFIKDSEAEAEYISDFITFYFKVSRSAGEFDIDRLHFCTQKYAANISRRPELKKLHLPFLYIKEIEYYMMVNSYSECVRCINKILDMEDVPDFCMGAALSQAVDIFIKSGITKEAVKYVDAMRTFVTLCELPPRNLIMLDCNLLQAYAFLGKRKEYEYQLDRIEKYSDASIDKEIRSVVILYVLGAKALIDMEKVPTDTYINDFCILMESGVFNNDITADYSEVMIPILRWIKGRMETRKLVQYATMMISKCETIADKLDMYCVLVDEFGLDRTEYRDFFDDYFKTLRLFADNSKEAHRHEVIGEMLSYEVERQYKKRALTDELTQLGNRHAYEGMVAEIVAGAQGGKLPSNVTIIAMDLNGLKHVNDTFGHQAGDDYIKAAAECLRNTVGNFGDIFRTGGDEFMAIVRTNHVPVEKITKLIKENMDNWPSHYDTQLSMAIGYATSMEYPDKTIDEIIGIADENMYKDKSLYYTQTGKDRRQR